MLRSTEASKGASLAPAQGRVIGSATNRRAKGTARMAVFEFVPPPRLNVPGSVTYTDTDLETGIVSVVPVAQEDRHASRKNVFQSLARMALVELGLKLGTDPDNPPQWMPSADQALADATRLTAPELFRRLVEDEPVGLVQAAETTAQASEGELCNLPRLFAAIGSALENVRDPDMADRVLLSQRSVDTLLKPARQVGLDAGEAIRALVRLLGAETVSVDGPMSLKLCAGAVSAGVATKPLAPVADVSVATAVLWLANVVTTGSLREESCLGIWLSDSNGNRRSPISTIQAMPDRGGTRFGLALTVDIGAQELKQMNQALCYLVEYWGMEHVSQ